MPRTALPVQTIAKNAGALMVQNASDQANGNSFPNDGRTRLVVNNGDGAPRTITVRSVPCSHGRSADIVLAVTNATIEFLGPLDPALYNQADGLTVNVDWSAGTTAACKVGVVSDVT